MAVPFLAPHATQKMRHVHVGLSTVTQGAHAFASSVWLAVFVAHRERASAQHRSHNARSHAHAPAALASQR
jgi:hypothetical protein